MKNSCIRKTGSKEAIGSALTELLDHRPLHKITVKELCERSGVHRSTFYAYYGSPEEVLSEMPGDYIQTTSVRILECLKSKESVYDKTQKALEYALENLPLTKVFMRYSYDGLLAQLKVSLPSFDSILYSNPPDSLDDTTKSAYVSFIQSGTIHLLKEWILDDNRSSVQDEVDMIFSIISKILTF